MASEKERGFLGFIQHHLVGVVLFAVLVGVLIGFYSSLFFLDSEWKPGIMYEDDHSHDHNDHSHSHGAAHVHEQYVITNPDMVPSLDINIVKDSKDGWNIQLITDNFEFDAASVNKEHIVGRGHAHLYIDGQKITRLYGNWYHIPELDSGRREIRVTLNTNDHKDYVYRDQVIEAKTTLLVP